MVEGRRGLEAASEPPFPLPEDVAALQFAYSLADSKGYVELVGADDQVLKRLTGKWLMTENLTMRTTGTYPHIRLRAERGEVHGLVVTGTSCVIVGTPKAPDRAV